MTPMSNAVGLCSQCGGNVVDIDLSPCGTSRKLIGRPDGPVFRCVKCGAHKARKPPPLPVLEMERPKEEPAQGARPAIAGAITKDNIDVSEDVRVALAWIQERLGPDLSEEGLRPFEALYTPIFKRLREIERKAVSALAEHLTDLDSER